MQAELTGEKVLKAGLHADFDGNGIPNDYLVPPTALYKNHGKYVSAMAKQASEYLAQGLRTIEQRDAFVSSAAKSEVGKPQ